MIGKFELSQAMEGHVQQTSMPQALMAVLKIDESVLHHAIAALTEIRKPLLDGAEGEIAYRAGAVDFFLIGVKAQIAEVYARCQGCGEYFDRNDNDPVPKDFDPMTMTFLCHSCQVTAIASNN